MLKTRPTLSFTQSPTQSRRTTYLRRTTLARLMGAVLLGCIALPAAASNFGFMKNTLPSQLSDSDMQQLKVEISTVLEQTPDKKITQWQAPQSKLSVKILPKLSYTEAGIPCRRTLLNFSSAPKNTETYGFTICKNAQGQWQISQSRLQTLGNEDLALIETHALQALNDNNIGTPITWFNPNSKINGTVVLVSAAQKNQQPCKTLAISLFDAEGVSLEGQYLLCNGAEGWKRASF
jgi:surface antigen